MPDGSMGGHGTAVGGDLAAIQRLLEETFVLAAGRLKECASGKTPMSEWLLSIYEPLAADIPAARYIHAADPSTA